MADRERSCLSSLAHSHHHSPVATAYSPLAHTRPSPRDNPPATAATPAAEPLHISTHPSYSSQVCPSSRTHDTNMKRGESSRSLSTRRRRRSHNYQHNTSDIPPRTHTHQRYSLRWTSGAPFALRTRMPSSSLRMSGTKNTVSTSPASANTAQHPNVVARPYTRAVGAKADALREERDGEG